MKSMHLLLDEAENKWRKEVRKDFPLRANTPVVRSTQQNGRDWTFSTDMQSIFAHIANDEALREKFETVVTKYWDGKPEELAQGVLHYLLYHELYHPLEAPFSVVGENNDNKRIHQAIRRGVLQAEPTLSPLEQIMKVQASQNGVKDFILDNRFALDNGERKYVREDIIPVWDVLELDGEKSKTNFYTATRLLYGLLYGPKSTHDFFEDKSGKKGHEVAEMALSALLQREVKLPKKKTLAARAKAFLSTSRETEGAGLQEYVGAIRQVFSKDDRYRGIERFMKVLGPYIEKGMPQGRPDMQGEGAGVSPQNILQDLLDDMNPSEQQQFVQSLAQESPSSLEQALQFANGKKPSDNSSVDQMKGLDLLAIHEFYKRNHPRVIIRGGSQVGESVIVGKRQVLKPKRSTIITQDQLGKLNLRQIATLQQRTRLPWLTDLRNGTYRLDEYQVDERNIKDIVYKDAQIDVPDVTEFYVDSSGSMFAGGTDNFVNNGGRWDMLSHVMYGFVDALRQAGTHVQKNPKMRIHNFANKQVDSEVIPVDRFWNGDTSALRVLFKPENGYNQEDLNLTNYRDGQKRAYVVVTDGELVIEGRTERESKKMKELAADRNNHVVLFEIGGTYDLGQAVKNDPRIVYRQVHNKQEMLQTGVEVLLSK